MAEAGIFWVVVTVTLLYTILTFLCAIVHFLYEEHVASVKRISPKLPETPKTKMDLGSQDHAATNEEQKHMKDKVQTIDVHRCTIDVFKKTYNEFELCDLERDIRESVYPQFNPKLDELPRDEFGFSNGEYTVTIEWKKITK